MINRAGEYKTILSGELSYKAFKVSPLPPVPPIQINDEMVDFLTKAHNKLGKLDGIAVNLPDIDLFISAYVRKEALLSSQIEGTQATIEDIFGPEIESNTNQDIGDVINYIKALNFAIEEMKRLPICNRLLKDAHRVLMQGVRGTEKQPGEFRKSQNWIGAPGSTLKTARYIPPCLEDMMEAMSDLEKFINVNEDIDILIKTALVHYQFESIHPFLDGNGRIGRMLIVLMLLISGLINYPILYISYFLKLNRIEYYDRLSDVRRSGNYEQWINFFLNGIVQACDDSISTIEKIVKLRERNSALIQAQKAKSVKTVYAYIESNPIIDIGKTADNLGISFVTASKAINILTELGILEENSNKARNRIFEYTEYLNILKTGTII
ncbi:MAG: Fic family protein [Clostridiales bacterium]|jgi:Fic family protein|nr:Fic family protein [Clostridiales bacterium]